jgi:hypothetical protein
MRDADDSHGGSIPQFRAIHFGNGHIEAGPQLVFQTAYDLATVFDRLRSFDVKLEGEKSDGHSVVSRWSFVVGKPDHGTTNDQPRCLRDNFRRDPGGGEGFDHIACFDVTVVGD